MCYTGLMDNNFIEVSTHPYWITFSENDQSVGYFSNIDSAVRTARDFSFYQGVSEFPLPNRLRLQISNIKTNVTFHQDYIDSRFMELSLLDATV